jgi:hypothetical protein
MKKHKAKKKAKYAAGCGVNLPDLRTIKVTQRHIDDGIPGDSDSCAIALAVKDVLDAAGIEYTEVSVGASDDSHFDCDIPISTPVVVNGKAVESIDRTAQVHVELNLGKKADKFISKFDEDECDVDGEPLPRKGVKPTSFKSKPAVSVELG